MPTYNYARVATQEGGAPQGGVDTSDTFTKKRDLCLGFLVLSAIVYVLARAGSTNCNELAAGVPPLQQGGSGSSSSAPAAASSSLFGGSAKPKAAAASFDFSGFDIGAYRTKILSQSTPHIIECIEAGEGGSQEACHLSRTSRYASLNQKGVTLWMTGLSGSGKSTIASLLEEQLVLLHGKNVYRLDGDNIRTGLNRDLGFSKADRAESVRRVGELACLFNDAGIITIVSLVSPYREDRDTARKRHADQKLKFLELFMDVPLSVVQDRDPKGLYKKVAAGELKGFTGVDDPYEAPTHAELSIKNQEMTVQAAVDIIMRRLVEEGVLVGGPTLPKGLPYPDGDEIVDLLVPAGKASALRSEAATLPKALLTDIDVNWMHTVTDGWAAPLKGFMREGALLQTIHFNSMLVDPYNITGNKAANEMRTDFLNFNRTQPPKRVSMSVPIVLPCTDYTKAQIESSGKQAVALVNKHGHIMAVLRNPEIYANRKEEIVSRIFGVIDRGHPYIAHIYGGGDWLIGGEIELIEKIRYNDGLDQYRLTAPEVMQKFVDKGADAVYAFQTRNPTHAGHAYLMKTGGEMLKKKGFKRPILWLSPLGGWTKSDDVPLDVRVKQHEAVIRDGMLDADTTVMAIWPAPMIYAGPTEVLFHAKSRRNAGATYFVAGRDPAGMKGSSQAVASPEDDLYNGDHGRYVLTMSPGQDPMNILPFAPVSYDKRDNTMKAKDLTRASDFIDISGSKMRTLAANGATPCGDPIPSDLVAANCVPKGFMVESGWKIVCEYYQNTDSSEWVPYSIMNVEPFVGRSGAYSSKHEGVYGTKSFKLSTTSAGAAISVWHDVPLQVAGTDLYNFVVEIPMYSTAKMEMAKDVAGNPIMQDTKNDLPRYYTYGVPFFNYGLLPQTWEDTTHVDAETGAKGDGDPIDAIEIGLGPLGMGSVVRVKVLGSLELIDEGETDHKVLVLREDDPHFKRINSVDDLESYRPGTVKMLVDWLKHYKTSDQRIAGKEEKANTLKRDAPTTPDEAKAVIAQTAQMYQDLMSGRTPNPGGYCLGKGGC